ncbi:MAG: DUF488 domain-containing protein [Bacteroidales bacterium]|jgi:uncharacterized protein (DUF488 family)|nr:DUF488 domain-containing protein [Bacteroidales bacterium]
MYYRRKVLLALLETFDGRLEKISLQKLLMLVTKQQEKPVFYFVPHKFGCFSFQANADLATMTKYNQVKVEGNCWIKTDNSNYLLSLKERDRQAIRYIKMQYGYKNADELIKHTYIKFPYFAINSTIASERLNPNEYQKVLESRPKSDKTILFTIGYEGISLEEYLNKLIINDIKVLCDVRKNSVSMKYGFSKSQLEKACNGVGVKYVHIPELGIESDKRQILNTQSDYDNLFMSYRNEILPQTINIQKDLLGLLIENERIALTCFEANICQCHRKHLADAITKLPGFDYELKHI